MRFDDVLVLCGPDLEPFQCASFEAQGDTIKQIQKTALVSVCDGAKRVIIPGLYNSHTHMGDSFLPDGTTGMTLEQGFLRPNVYKYRQPACQCHPLSAFSMMRRDQILCRLLIHFC
ncbi:MAG: hypothetical protein HRU10_09195 [Opitutales bacterium]|nr:hypothetical protein [Opitutales bacterium]